MIVISASSARRKVGLFQKERFYFFKIVDGGILTPNPPPVRTPLGASTFHRSPIILSIFYRIEPEVWPGYQLKIPSSAGASKYGLMTCTVRDNVTDEETSVTGVLMSQNGKQLYRNQYYSRL